MGGSLLLAPDSCRCSFLSPWARHGCPLLWPLRLDAHAPPMSSAAAGVMHGPGALILNYSAMSCEKCARVRLIDLYWAA